jgi:hypothetical protein
MKKRYTDEQIIKEIKEQEAGAKVEDKNYKHPRIITYTVLFTPSLCKLPHIF